MQSFFKFAGAASLVVAISGCATLSPDGDAADIQQLVQGKTSGVAVALTHDPLAVQAAVAELLKGPITAESAVRIALLNNPGLQASMATLGVSDADRAAVAISAAAKPAL